MTADADVDGRPSLPTERSHPRAGFLHTGVK
jgi:hypothetical protein